jgi:hypothetical protein
MADVEIELVIRVNGNPLLDPPKYKLEDGALDSDFCDLLLENLKKVCYKGGIRIKSECGL